MLKHRNACHWLCDVDCGEFLRVETTLGHYYARSAVVIVFDKQKVSFVSLFCEVTFKDGLEKSSFLHTLYLKNEAKTSKNKYRTVFNTFKSNSMRNLELF